MHVEREAEFDKVVMAYPSSATARTGISVILAIVGLVALYFWFGALIDLFDGRSGSMDVWQVLFTTLILGFVVFMGSFAFRRPVPESVMVVGKGIIHDSGTDPFRKTALEKSEARQSEQFVKPRKRMHFSSAEVATLSKTDFPYENRIYIEADGKRHDLGEALSAAERAWLYDFLLEKLDRPEKLNRQATELVIQVEAEERIKPLITDVHSGHRVDPLDFDDPVAQRADWATMADSSASFQTHKLVRGRRQLAFEATTFARLFGLLFPSVGLIAIGFSLYQFVIDEITAEFVFVFIFGSVFFVAGLYLVRKTFEPIVFSLRRAQFRKGWSDAQPVPLEEVYGLQLLSFTPSQSVHTAYELNVLLRDGSRRHVICHGDPDALRMDTDSLSRFLSKPVFDGIVPERSRLETFGRSKVEDRSLTWQAIVFAIIVVGTIVVWMLGDESDPDRSIVVDESTNQSPAVGRPVSFAELVEEAQRRDRIGDRQLAHLLYQELLRQIRHRPISKDERTRLLADAADFYFRGNELPPGQVERLLLDAVANEREAVRVVYEQVLERTRDRGQPVTHIEELIQKSHQPTAKRPAPTSAVLAFPRETSSSKPISPDADWATVDLLTKEILPEGVYVETSYIRNGQIRVLGYADNHRTVAEYLRVIQANGGRPNVDSVNTAERNQRSVSAFSITIASSD